MKLRWGIVGCSRISEDFVTALALLPADEHEVVAVAAGDVNRAKAFAAKRNLGHAASYGTYEELYADPSVDVVYIGNINYQHKDCVIGALNAGKHVLCEKPLGCSLKEVQEMVDLARSKNRFFMEGVWSRFFPAMTELKKRVAAGEIGKPMALHASFGFPIEGWRMEDDVSGGGGAAYDVGGYTIQLALFIFGRENLLRAEFAGQLAPNKNLDACGSITLFFKGGETAFLSFSGVAELPNYAVLSGDKVIDKRAASIKLLSFFWCPDSLEMSGTGEVVKFPPPGPQEGFHYFNSAGLAYQAASVRNCIMQEKRECPCMPWEESIFIARLLQGFREKVGISFPQD